MEALRELIETYVPAPVRLALYAVAGLGLVGVAAWQASNGDWLATAVAILGAVANGTAAAKTEDVRKVSV